MTWPTLPGGGIEEFKIIEKNVGNFAKNFWKNSLLVVVVLTKKTSYL